MMKAVDWHRVKEVFADALDRPPAERSAFLDQACAGDTALRAEVESLISAHSRAGEFIQQPALATLADTLDEVFTDPNIGRAVGPYVIERLIGRGGMGTVYEARRADREFEQRVAIKMIRRGMDTDIVIERFRHERQILASLDHPHVARIFDGGTTEDGLPYFVMEYVDGLPIDRYADTHRLPTNDRLRLCLQVFEAVAHAHDRLIVHRDLKPSNVLITSTGHPKLLDFGIAKILDPEGGSNTVTMVGRAMTPDYASPEQLQGLVITQATDVYALGLLLYELLTGHRPFGTGLTPAESARLVCEEDPESMGTVIDRVIRHRRDDGTEETVTAATVSERRDGSPERLRKRLTGALDAIVLKALRKEPEARYPSVAALAADVQRYLATEPVDATRGALVYRALRWQRRHRSAIGIAALIVAAVGTTLLLTRTQSDVEPAQSRSPSTAASPSIPARRSVAVATVRPLSRNPDDAWLSTAIAEMLTTELAGDGQLRVIPSDQIARVAIGIGIDFTRAPDASQLAALQAALGADLLALGTFAIAEERGVRTVRLDVRVLSGTAPVAAAGTQGDPSQLFTLVVDASRELRRRIGLKEAPADATTAARAAFPTSLEATRLYAEGVARLRVLDAAGARERLEAAAALETTNPMVQSALASAWTALGYDPRAAAAAQRAFDGAGALGREERLNVEGRLYEATRQWDKAVDVYRTLWGFFSDNLEYGLRLASAQRWSGRPKDALGTIETLRRLPPPQNQDPRIELQEADTQAELGDFNAEFAAIARARRLAERSGERGLLARARSLEGRNLRVQGKPAEALESMREAARLYEEIGDGAGAATALRLQAAVLRDQQDLTQAIKMNEASLRASEAIGHRQSMSAALTNLGILFKDTRRFPEALAAHERALALRRELADANGIAASLSNIGIVLYEQDRFSEAAARYSESLAITLKTGDKRAQISAQHNRAIIDRETGNLAAARAAYESSLALRREIGDRRGQCFGLVELGMVQLAQGEIDAARRTQEQALELARAVKLRPGEGQALYQLGDIALAAGDLKAARLHHEAALAIRRAISETRTVLESRTGLAWLTLEEGRPVDAEREATAVLNALGDEPAKTPRASLTLLQARARIAARNLDGAARALASARTLAARNEHIEILRTLAMTEAELALARGQTQEARQHLARLGARLAAAGMVLADLERRALQLRVDAADQQPSFTTAAAQLTADAEARHAGLIARRVRALTR